MFQVRIHGRGGQGVVSGAEMLSVAAFLEGRYAQAFPSFGSERMGAPVMAFCRIDDREIRLREPVVQPDALIIQDPTLLHQVDLFKGLSAGGYILINSTRSFAELGLSEFTQGFRQARLCTVPATEIAMKHVGRPMPNAALLGGFRPDRLCTLPATEIALKHVGRPVPNVPLLAAFAAITGQIRQESVIKPDALIIQDPTLLHQVDLFKGLSTDGYILINSTRSFEELGLTEFVRRFRPLRLCTLPATEIAMKHVGRPVPNAALLGGFAAISGEIRIASVVAAIREKFPAALAEKNVAAATEAHALVAARKEPVHA